ncbi:hypothetical protein PHYSODRAFT_342418 [Phytophthora sojae]|uniref:Uncharacterized protein n=1 Tax=Phytophthora sojae (strain P6497) TaxID=1094619 RepID=G5AGB4_PHYSP|nr:hypothetical protein PHYSODRAFT_342418 [Phytophthora sojae]EGZ05626.1 hypothetical protein PHYSODRAFT_342418 [Phytophthora sojae]|eukprot:XP_009539157.1 hypothetical protein PHYSODRAFT_342418 [Phytophthora sojae]
MSVVAALGPLLDSASPIDERPLSLFQGSVNGGHGIVTTEASSGSWSHESGDEWGMADESGWHGCAVAGREIQTTVGAESRTIAILAAPRAVAAGTDGWEWLTKKISKLKGRQCELAFGLEKNERWRTSEDGESEICAVRRKRAKALAERSTRAKALAGGDSSFWTSDGQVVVECRRALRCY